MRGSLSDLPLSLYTPGVNEGFEFTCPKAQIFSRRPV